MRCLVPGESFLTPDPEKFSLRPAFGRVPWARQGLWSTRFTSGPAPEHSPPSGVVQPQEAVG